MPLLDLYDSFLFDLDGVLYRGDRAVAGAAETVRHLRAAGKGLAFVTNNSARTPAQVAEKLGSIGVEAPIDEIVTSAVATGELLGRDGVRRAFVIGEDGILEALRRNGIEVLEGDRAVGADAVVVGWDRRADYEKLKTAALLVQRGARLVATNPDASYPAPDGLWPGAGALLAAVTTTTGTEPEIVGKPHAPLFELARERAGGGVAISIGDRLDTDVAGATRLGWDSLLVFSGVTTTAQLVRADGLPTFVGRGPSAVLEPAARVREAAPSDGEAVMSLLREAGLSDGASPEMLETSSWVAQDLENKSAAGTVASERAGHQVHLRSLAVASSHRGRGLGALLVAHALRRARHDGARDVFVVTETAEGFFTRLGFAAVGRLEALPGPFRDHMTSCSDRARVLRFHP